jgi:enamine deaminase RidA (YjgF/YER057c/UK114 family)
MRSVSAKLAEVGLILPLAAKPVAAYSSAIKTGNLVFTAGQLPLIDEVIPITGKVGVDVGVDEAKTLAKVCALNALSAVQTVADIDTIVKVVRVTGYVNCNPGFISQPTVVNGASELYLHIWGESGKHARSAIGVAELPLNAPVEIEVIFELSV